MSIQDKIADVRNVRHSELGRLALRDTEQFFLPSMEDVVNHPKHYNKHGVE